MARGDLASKVHGPQWRQQVEDYIVKLSEMLELLVHVENAETPPLLMMLHP